MAEVTWFQGVARVFDPIPQQRFNRRRVQSTVRARCTLTGIRKILVGALVVSLLAVVGSGAALYRTFDHKSSSGSSTPQTTLLPGPVLVEIPSVIDKNGMTAAADLANLKLRVTVTTGPSVTTPKDNVIDQNPAAGTQVPEGSAVNLKLSSGPI